jgi:predicted metal-dependent peptidase
VSSIYRTYHKRSELPTQLIIEHSPAMASLLFWARHEDREPDPFLEWIFGNLIAATDGRTVWYYPDFDRMDLREQAFVVCHEICHIAFCHALRASILAAREADFDPNTWNEAADLIINNSLIHQPWLQRPQQFPGVVLHHFLEELRGKMSHDEFKKLPEEHEWDTERLYLFLQYTKSDDPNMACPVQASVGAAARDAVRKMLADAEGSGGDLKIDSKITDRPELRQEMREWARRIAQAQMGDRPGGILRKLAGDIPKTKTPWQEVTRQIAMALLAPKTEPTWSRPSRRYLGLRRTIPYEQGIRPQPKAKLALLVDTSGSISNATFNRWISEIHTIQASTGADVYVIVSDAAVHTIHHLKDSVQDLRRVKFVGGGGTDFRPAFIEAEKLKPGAVIYLTDLDGVFPEKAPKAFKTFWAVPERDVKAVPFGKIIELD